MVNVLNLPLPAMLYIESVSVSSASPSYGHFTDLSLRTGLCPPLCVDQWRRLLQNHLHTDVWVPAWERTMPPSLLRMSTICVTCGCHGDASENAGRAEVNVQRVGAKAVWLWGWHSPAQWCKEIVRSPPPELLGGLSFCTHSHPERLSCYCCANMFKLMNIQVLACPYTLLTAGLNPTDLIIICTLSSTFCRIQKAKFKTSMNTRAATNNYLHYRFSPIFVCLIYWLFSLQNIRKQ